MAKSVDDGDGEDKIYHDLGGLIAKAAVPNAHTDEEVTNQVRENEDEEEIQELAMVVSEEESKEDEDHDEPTTPTVFFHPSCLEF